MVNKKKLIIMSIILTIFSLILILFFIRLISPIELDDVTPGISCNQNLIEKSDILWIIPNFNNTNISENIEWCNRILNENKTLGLHGITHEYQEFGKDVSSEYLNEGMEMFIQCFGFAPEKFKPPQLKINSNNKELIANNNLKLSLYFNQITHKVYHCDDSDIMKNNLIDLF